MKTIEKLKVVVLATLLGVFLLVATSCSKEDDCDCQMVTYEHWNDGTLDHWKLYSQLDVDCTEDVQETIVKTLDNGHELKVLIECN
tara:strand:- start:235 stop:492 length:258 start_codon:yes stop_codon:yes gene_type:complete